MIMLRKPAIVLLCVLGVTVGDAAMYRLQGFCATTEKKSKSGESQWLEIRVHNVEGAAAAADTKRFAIELAKRAAARL
jgi:hypothetical protein